jgi:hypothetical protein
VVQEKSERKFETLILLLVLDCTTYSKSPGFVAVVSVNSDSFNFAILVPFGCF